MPTDDAMKPFYVLGVNIALQVGNELKTMLSKEELDLCIKGFTDSMTGAAGDEKGMKCSCDDIHIYVASVFRISKSLIYFVQLATNPRFRTLTDLWSRIE